MPAFDFGVDHGSAGPEAEPAIDGAFGRPQRRQRLSPFANFFQMVAHHLPQDSPTAVSGENRDHGGPGRRDDCAGYRHLEAERAGGADHLGTIECGDRAVYLQNRVERILAFVGRIEKECQTHHPAELGSFVFGDAADGEVGHESIMLGVC